MKRADMKYDVVVGSKVIGYTWGPNWGGLVYGDDNDGDVVGTIRHDPDIDFYSLRAELPHHTGKQHDGEKLFVSNRPRPESE